LTAGVPTPPFLAFPDQKGGFLVFQEPWGIFSGPDLPRAEALALSRGGWISGGLSYAPAERPAPGWWGVFPAPRRVSRDELETWADPSVVRTGPLASSLTFEEYAQAFSTVRKALAEGTSYQVNLTFALTGRAVSGSAWSWRSALRLWLDLIAGQGREACFAVLGTGEGPGPILVSASPELFFQQEGPVVESRPMKGTAARHDDPVEDAISRHALVSSLKVRAENLMITDMLRNDLGRLAVPGGVSVPRLFDVEEYPTVWQMTSTVRAQLPSEPSLQGLMGALFPCASITGAPKIATQRVIASAEAQPRGWYTGTLGWHRPASPVEGPCRSRFSVLIRTLVFDQPDSGLFHLGVGGGIVWDSTAQEEWDEAWAKARFMASTQREFCLTEAVLWTPQEGPTLVPEHESRLRLACRAFGPDLEEGALGAALDKAVSQQEVGGLAAPLKLRVLVDPDLCLRVEAEVLRPLPEVLTIALADRPFGPESLLFRRFKTTDRSVYDQARVAGVDQTIHFNERGELTESTSMNLVLEKDGQFLTPAASCGLLEGTFRARLLAEGTIVEAILPRQALESADRVWLINSVRGWKLARKPGTR